MNNPPYKSSVQLCWNLYSVKPVFFGFTAMFFYQKRALERSQRSFILILIVTLHFFNLNSLAASGDRFEDGVSAFSQGKYGRAREVFGPVITYGGEDRVTILAKAYMIAMDDEVKAPGFRFPDRVITTIQEESAGGNLVFQVLEGRLHLLGHHPELNKEKGLNLITTASVRKIGYAYYTLGLVAEGRFGGDVDLEIAANWYKLAHKNDFQEAMGRLEGIRDVLDRIDAAAGAGWDGGSTWGDGSEILSDYREDGDHDVVRGAGVGSSTVIGRRLERGKDKKGLEGESAYTKTTVGAGVAGGVIAYIPTTVPAIAVGYEAMYRRFLEARLEYRPDPKSDSGMIILPFRDILAPIAGTANPLSGTFDLARCGQIGKWFSIHTGYKKAKITTNAGKVEIWICPKFLVERELDIFKIGGGLFSRSKHPFSPVMDKWYVPVGYFWTWGDSEVQVDNYDYLLDISAMGNHLNLFDRWRMTTFVLRHTIGSRSGPRFDSLPIYVIL